MKKIMIALCAAVIGMFCLTGCGPDINELTKEVKASMEEEYGKKGGKIKSLTLVHESGNKYVGVADVTLGEFHIGDDVSNSTELNITLDVNVLYDGGSFIWEAKPSK